jgi:hypothetical protein
MIVVTPVPFRGDNFACNLPRKVAIAAMTATIYFRTVRGAHVPQSSARHHGASEGIKPRMPFRSLD